MADVLAIADDFDSAHGVGDCGEFMRHTHGVENFLGADVQDERFGDILRAGGFVNNAARNTIAGHFRSECQADRTGTDNKNGNGFLHTLGRCRTLADGRNIFQA
jgi:hypothetical protein